jgi:hypothetical protein
MKWLLFTLLVAGCATASPGVARHTPAPLSYAIDSIELEQPRAGQLSAARLWERSAPNRAVHAGDDAALRDAFLGELGRAVPLDPAAPRRLRATLTLQDAGYYEGLAAETTDVTLTADVLDANGVTVRTITLREPASAPLQRSASRRARLQAAFDRLAERLAAQL